MRVAKEIALTIMWFGIWLLIPAAFLCPMAIWLLKNTSLSADDVAQAYCFAVTALFLPTGCLVDVIYRRLILNKRRPR